MVDLVGDIDREYFVDPFIALINSIVFQQLSYNVANTIWDRFVNLFENITPKAIMEKSFDELRKCGLSKTKIDYMRNVSEAVLDGYIDFSKFKYYNDKKIINKLIKIKGIGDWTAEMFLIFALNRKDILAYKDLGIRKGIKWLYNLKKEPTKIEFEKIKKIYSPNNTLASFYLWEITLRNYYKYDNINEIYTDNNIMYLNSPIGLIEIHSNGKEVVKIQFVDEKRYKEKKDKVLNKSYSQLKEYFQGKRFKFDLPLKIEGTEFQNNVWNELIKIPYGYTYSYKEVAKNIGNENASRAVGNANNKNILPIIIPCHRVIGSNGNMKGYEGGLWRKKWLLDHENDMIKKNNN